MVRGRAASYPLRVALPPHFARAGTWAAFCALLACTPPPPAAPVAVSPEPSPASEPDPEAAADADPERSARSAALERVTARSLAIADEIAGARKLARTRDFEVELIDREGVRAFVLEEMYEDMTPEKMRLLGRIESSLGVLPVGADAEKVLLDLYEEGVLGIYDPERKTLLIGDYVAEQELDMVVGHEIAHALQDMHFDLEALQKPVDGQSDRDAAKTFLVEGEAQAAFTVWALRAMPTAADLSRQQFMADRVLELSNEMEHATLIRMLQMPYTDGTATVMAAVKERGWGVIDELYGRLPVSSEQMLHVEKLLADERPRAITSHPEKLTEAMPEHTIVWEDELGEAFLLAALADVAPAFEAREAAAGWDGDRYFALDHQSAPAQAPIVVGFIAWDSSDDARDFEREFERYLQKTKADQFALDRRGDRIVFVTEAGDDAKRLIRTAWRTFESGARPPSEAR